MDRSQATYEAYDGVELQLLNGRVVRCDALTVAEAVHYLRLLASIGEDPDAHDTLMSEFPERIGILDVQLADIGLEVEGIELGDLTLKDGFEMVGILATALGDAFSVESSKAKVRVLDEFPVTFGVEGLKPPEVFTLARTFAERLYLLIYGLAQDFCQHLTLSPGVKVMVLRAATDPSPMRA